ncbi:death effector domain-containing protein [Lingula anatina]|uniref:Death effector domain-containing protein n=1 Tax=Lingula anatina TaxID=7574 RepID=A0A1S3JX51_LINAN|nr:death effector domain-containing protein [Lingula anatina]|eukprot:XP_013414953.1 death effector domain-containing protein [Lingula anatina]
MAETDPSFGSRKNFDPTLRSLQDMYRDIGNQLAYRDLISMKIFYFGSLRQGAHINDGYSMMMELERAGRIDESDFSELKEYLRKCRRHDLLPYVTLRKRKKVSPDPVDQYLEESKAQKPSDNLIDCSSQPGCSHWPRNSVKQSQYTGNTASDRLSSSAQNDTVTAQGLSTCSSHSSKRKVKCLLSVPAKRHCRGRPPRKRTIGTETREGYQEDIKKKVTCDIRLRVRAEYCQHETALQGNVHSNKPELIERQFEKFSQANTILKSRDLGSIICDIKFSELTYLDAFWRDYINGSLLEALKGVFLTESLKQAVGNEAIKLLVSVDEDDYEAGRLKLLQNLKE